MPKKTAKNSNRAEVKQKRHPSPKPNGKKMGNASNPTRSKSARPKASIKKINVKLTDGDDSGAVSETTKRIVFLAGLGICAAPECNNKIAVSG